MTTKTTDLWLFRDPDGSYWGCDREPRKYHNGKERVWGTSDGLLFEWKGPIPHPTLRKGTKRRIRVTVEVLR